HSMAHGERQLDPGRTAPDGEKPYGLLAVSHARHDPLPLLGQLVDRLHGRGVLGGARDRAQMRRRADIYGKNVVGDRRALAAENTLACEVDTDSLVMDQPCTRKTCERPQIDVT